MRRPVPANSIKPHCQNTGWASQAIAFRFWGRAPSPQQFARIRAHTVAAAPLPTGHSLPTAPQKTGPPRHCPPATVCQLPRKKRGRRAIAHRPQFANCPAKNGAAAPLPTGHSLPTAPQKTGPPRHCPPATVCQLPRKKRGRRAIAHRPQFANCPAKNGMRDGQCPSRIPFFAQGSHNPLSQGEFAISARPDVDFAASHHRQPQMARLPTARRQPIIGQPSPNVNTKLTARPYTFSRFERSSSYVLL